MDDSKEFQSMLDGAIKSEALAFKGFDRTKNVQDQLQAMVSCGDLEADLLDFWYEFLDDGRFDIPIWAINAVKTGKHEITVFDDELKFTSMEQLYLAYIMKELHNKAWVNDEWV